MARTNIINKRAFLAPLFSSLSPFVIVIKKRTYNDINIKEKIFPQLAKKYLLNDMKKGTKWLISTESFNIKCRIVGKEWKWVGGVASVGCVTVAKYMLTGRLSF